MLRLSFLAVFHNCHHSSTLAETKLYENLTFHMQPRLSCTELYMPDNNNNNSYNIRKIPIQLTSVGLAHIHPNYIYDLNTIRYIHISREREPPNKHLYCWSRWGSNCVVCHAAFSIKYSSLLWLQPHSPTVSNIHKAVTSRSIPCLL